MIFARNTRNGSSLTAIVPRATPTNRGWHNCSVEWQTIFGLEEDEQT